MIKPLLPPRQTSEEINAEVYERRRAEENGHDDFDAYMEELNSGLIPERRIHIEPALEPEEVEADDAEADTEEDVDPDLERMNARYWVVDMGGKARVGEFKRSVIFKDCLVPQYSTFADFRALKDRERKTIEDTDSKNKEIGLGSWWLKHPQRRQYEGVKFDPDASSEDNTPYLNLWQGFGITAEQGDWSLYCGHLLDNVCNGVEEYFEYLLDWMAFAVQYPGRRGEVAIVLRGTEGVGKGIVLRYFGEIFGPHYRHISQAGHLVGHFNAHLQQVAVLFADEAFFAADRAHEGILKALITEPTLMIEPKGLDTFPVKNCLKIWMSSNAEWVIPAGHDARRFFVLDVAAHKKQNHDYFAAIANQMESGGCEALLYDLLLRDLSQFNVRQAPQTAALADQKKRSRRGIDRLIEQICTEGKLPAAHLTKPDVSITSGEDHGSGLYPAARKIAPDLKHVSSAVIRGTLKDEWGCKNWKSAERGLLFLPLKDLREQFDQKHGAQDWPEINDWGDTEDSHDG